MFWKGNSDARWSTRCLPNLLIPGLESQLWLSWSFSLRCVESPSIFWASAHRFDCGNVFQLLRSYNTEPTVTDDKSPLWTPIRIDETLANRSVGYSSAGWRSGWLTRSLFFRGDYSCQGFQVLQRMSARGVERFEFCFSALGRLFLTLLTL